MTNKLVLIGYWPLNESSGSTAYDHSGNENEGSISGAGPVDTGTVSGPLGQSAYRFDGSDDVVSTSFSYRRQVFSVSIWFKTSDSNGSIISLYDDSSNDGFYLDINSNGRIATKYEKGSYSNGESWHTDPSYNDGNWHHVVATRINPPPDFTDNQALYVDGRQPSMTTEQTNTHDAKWDSSRKLRIGKHQTNHNNGIDARISEVRFYNHAVTAGEAQYLYSVSQRGRQVTSSKSS